MKPPATTRGAFLVSAAGALGASALPAPLLAASDDPLTQLLVRAKAANTDQLTILRDGALVAEYSTKISRPIDSMSVTKSIVSLAIGLLVDDKKLTLETRAADFYPQWHNTPKSTITVRHLVGHTSGIATKGKAEKYFEHTDLVRFALGLDLDAVPGTLFAYNNVAYCILTDLVRKVAGKPIDAFLRERLFGPLGIDQFEWGSDRANNRLGQSGFTVRSADLAKIGQLLIARGTLNGRQLISERWLQVALAPQSALQRNTGLFWWLMYERSNRKVTAADIARWRAAGVPGTLVDRVAEIQDKSLTSEEYVAALRQRLGSEGFDAWGRALATARTAGATLDWGSITGFNANGFLGQFLIVFPEKKMVIARMIHRDNSVTENDVFFDIFPLSAKLAGVPYG